MKEHLLLPSVLLKIDESVIVVATVARRWVFHALASVATKENATLVLWTMLIAIALTTCRIGSSAEQSRVHAVVDLGHQFTFYADGRFHRQYLPGQPAVTSWGSLFNFDFSNANLLVLLGCDPHLEYVAQDIEVINKFLQQGGGVVLLGSARDKSQNTLAGQFGCSFGKPAQKPLKNVSDRITGEIVGGGDTIELHEPGQWHVLLADAQNRPVLASRMVGKGTLLVGARGLAGRNPNAQDNINASWWQPLLVEVASGKTVDSGKPFRSRGIGQLEHTEHLGSITLRYSDYLKPYAQSMADIYLRCRPVIEKRMGVPLSEGMASEIGLLATGGGGFSSGRTGARELDRGEANNIHWGKTYWIFEQLRKDNPQVVTQYFQAKRRLATPDKIKRYDENVTVALLSIAIERDLFPWFKEYGIEVDGDKSPIRWGDTGNTSD